MNRFVSARVDVVRVASLALACAALLMGALMVAPASPASPMGVEQAQAATVKISSKSVTLDIGHSHELTLKNAPTSKVSWSSSNKEVATVKKGSVTAVSPGTATIKAKYLSKTYTCKVKVRPLVFKASESVVNVPLGETATVTVTFRALGTVLWEVEDNSIASPGWSCRWNGYTTELKIKGLKPGSTTVKVANNMTADCFYHRSQRHRARERATGSS